MRLLFTYLSKISTSASVLPCVAVNAYPLECVQENAPVSVRSPPARASALDSTSFHFRERDDVVSTTKHHDLYWLLSWTMCYCTMLIARFNDAVDVLRILRGLLSSAVIEVKFFSLLSLSHHWTDQDDPTHHRVPLACTRAALGYGLNAWLGLTSFLPLHVSFTSDSLSQSIRAHQDSVAAASFVLARSVPAILLY